MYRRALVRPPSASMGGCISDHPMREQFSLELARRQHAAYVEALREIGLDVVELTPEPTLPDSCFVEDTAVVHESRALICRPRPPSRRAEVDAVEEVLAEHLHIRRATPPATIEGGDVIHFTERLVCGVSSRTTLDGVRQMEEWLCVRVDTVRDPAMFHLKSDVTAVSDELVIGTRPRIDDAVFDGLEKIVVPPEEAYAANTLAINGRVLVASGHPVTAARLRDAGLDVIELDMSEFEKCSGALTCLSILF